MRTIAAIVGSAGIAGIGLAHVAWGRGSSWPMQTRAELADAVVGSPVAPDPPECYAVAGAAAVAAAVVAGAGGSGRLATLARWGIVAVLATRGLAGGRVAVSALGLPEPSQRFIDLDNTVYRPLCFTLAAGTALSIRRRRGAAG
ncbi:DUF3995 domain-containing protein [Glaciibacter superstes]|uniref:DUF3995 domain-containing protein n=1 Tax=Glaciibacter superstes TaxID=501023 RepID=UPI0003B380C7|nr:DUF3995 domain-containing protein [Glaciibacter superstes]